MCPEGWVKLCKLLYNWQTLISGLLALGAAIAGIVYLHRQIRQTEELEGKRRAKKLAAIRAVGPLALSAIGEYAKQCTNVLKALHVQCGTGLALPSSSVALPDVPNETITLFSDFIEYSDDDEADLIEELMRDIQVQQSRLRGLVRISATQI
jgi:hypothetical protein